MQLAIFSELFYLMQTVFLIIKIMSNSMKKITMLSLLAALSQGAYTYAGTMGIIDSAPCLISFLALEGGYTWNQIENYDFSLTGLNGRFYSHKSDKGFSGRLAGGIIRPINEQFALSSEIGFGYYGRTNLNPVGTGIAPSLPVNLAIKNTLSGFDALVGVAYTAPSYSLFFKAGALIQNMSTRTNANFSPFDIAPANSVQSINYVSVLPELRVGGAYNLSSNWAVTASYFHAFGSNPKTTGNFNVNTLNASVNTNDRNPSLDAVMLGIQYSI